MFNNQESIEEDIPAELLPYLTEIAIRLWSNHAAVMIGAGFSKNAIKSVPTIADIPNWNELGDVFYEKLHKRKPEGNYLNVLKLADEIQSAFGRPVLDQLLRDLIRDQDYQPSRLHEELMELPWTDVFTTNYDTLLERTCENIVTQKFDVVVNQEDLVYSERPRIIKLHGSFPSERPLIITEEDYRKYPKTFAPFVNTVQQSLIENTLCLIGFSGDDPNFLQWIGWINDNLGKANAPQIYLIGILNLSEGQKRLLHGKNIVPIDLSIIKSAGGDHGKALKIFLHFLFKEKAKRSRLNWPRQQRHFSLALKNIELNEIVENWRNTRLEYPNWIILPEEKRNILWQTTNDLTSGDCINIENIQLIDLQFAFELNWRMEKCLLPIFNVLAPKFQKILNSFNPFPKELSNHYGSKYEEIEYPQIAWKDISFQWVELSLSLLRFYREEGFELEWSTLRNTLLMIRNYFVPDQIGKYHYEVSLQAIHGLDMNLALKSLEDWPENFTVPFWECRRAALMADLGKIKEAEATLSKSLNVLRKRLNLTPVTNDYSLVSQESYAMLLLRIISTNIELHFNGDEVVDIHGFNERWNHLSQYLCDPWAEMKYFYTVLQQSRQPVKLKETFNAFDIGATSTTYYLNPSDNDTMVAYSYFRFIEDIGLPLSLRHFKADKKTIGGAINRIAYFSPNWARAVLLRYGNKDLVDSFFNRDVLSRLKVADVDNQSLHFIEKFYELLPKIDENPIAQAFIENVLDILSRLAIKASEPIKETLFYLIQFVYRKELRLEGVKNLLKRLINASSKAMQYKMLPVLFDVPLISEQSTVNLHYLPEPGYFINFSDFKVEKPLKIKASIIIIMLELAFENQAMKKHAIVRLSRMNDVGLLSKTQSTQLFKLVWSNVDQQTKFPQETPFRKFKFLNYSHPKNVDPEMLFKKYIADSEFEIQGADTSIGMGRVAGESTLALEICGGSATLNHTGIYWDEQELTSIWKKCKRWWDTDKGLLTFHKKNDSLIDSIHEEFVARFANINNMIAYVFGYQKKYVHSFSSEIKIVLNEMIEYNIPILKSKVAFPEIFYGERILLLDDLDYVLQSSDRHRIVEALQACLLILELSEVYLNDQHFTSKLLRLLCEPVKWKDKNIMADCIHVLVVFINSKLNLDLEYLLPIFINYLTFNYAATSKQDNEFYSIQEKSQYRKNSIQLAYALYQRFIKEGKEIPDSLLKWNVVAHDPEEFSDITNNWS